jgi:hypothetical protein
MFGVSNQWMRNLIWFAKDNQFAFSPRQSRGSRLALLLIALGSMAAASVANAGGLRALPAVGPAEPEHTGYLVVYTATEPTDDGDVMYYTHTDYRLYSSSGVFLKTIKNSIVKGDEVPETVRLAPGRYMIHAQSETEGYVAVPVVIADGRKTVVNLEGDRRGRNQASR